MSLPSFRRWRFAASLGLALPLACVFAPPSFATAVRRTVVVVANMLDAEVEATPEQIADVLFNGPDSVAAFYSEATYGAFTFSGTVLDPVTIPFSTTSACFYWDWALAARQAAVASYNVDFDNYDHIVFALPSCPSCQLDGAANINGRNSWNFGKPLEHGIYSHELGHNFGLLHANTPGEEGGDFSSTMGYSDVMVHFNAPEKDAAGWIPPSRAFNVVAEANYRLAPLESQGGFDPLLLRIESQASPTERYYVSYRRPLGFDANLPLEFQDKISIHSSNGVGSPTLHAVLDDGEVFSDPAAGVYIRLIDHNDQYATFHFSGTAPVTALGDFNFDGVIGAADLAQWQLDFGMNAGSDADGDGDSDGTDFIHWQSALGGYTPPTAAVMSAPEPGAATLAVIAAAALRAALRRRSLSAPGSAGG
jgi:hypothetical protein